MKSMALYVDRKAIYDTKTTCFAVVETLHIAQRSLAYRTHVVCLWLKAFELTSRRPSAYFS
jgi:hypothetical protein